MRRLLITYIKSIGTQCSNLEAGGALRPQHYQISLVHHLANLHSEAFLISVIGFWNCRQSVNQQLNEFNEEAAFPLYFLQNRSDIIQFLTFFQTKCNSDLQVFPMTAVKCTSHNFHHHGNAAPGRPRREGKQRKAGSDCKSSWCLRYIKVDAAFDWG